MEAVGVNTPEELHDRRTVSRPRERRAATDLNAVGRHPRVQRRALHRHAARAHPRRRSRHRSASAKRSSSSTTDRGSDRGDRVGRAWCSRAPHARQRRQGQGRARRHRAGDRRPADHPGCRPGIRPERLRADDSRRYRRVAATSSTAVVISGAGGTQNQSLAAYLGGRSLSLVALLFTGRYLTDTVTAYKLFHRSDLAGLTLETSGFELDHEITARMLARGRRIVEVPISVSPAQPRGRQEDRAEGLVHRPSRRSRDFRNG